MNEFDKKAESWDSDPVKVERARVVGEAIRKRVPMEPGLRALEYGCGTGLLSFALQPYLFQITLADSSTEMLRVLKRKIAASGIRNMMPVRMDLSSAPTPHRERFGLIYTLMTLHHVSDTEGILRAFHALLERRGHLCIADLDKEEGAYHGTDFHGHTGFDRNWLREKVEKAGFQHVTFSTVYEMSKDTKHGWKVFPLFLMVAEKGGKSHEEQP
jgi:2-polyprenyl-3-methyl-5-hydroxy-6-metoxy-1,4-benzoquinol methylase